MLHFIGNLRFFCSLSQKFVAKSRSIHNFAPKSFCNVIRIIGSNVFLYSWSVLIKNLKKKLNSLKSELLVSIFSNSFLNSKLIDCSSKCLLFCVLNDFCFLLFIMSFNVSSNHFVEVRNTGFNSTCFLKTQFSICRKQIYIL